MKVISRYQSSFRTLLSVLPIKRIKLLSCLDEEKEEKSSRRPSLDHLEQDFSSLSEESIDFFERVTSPKE